MTGPAVSRPWDDRFAALAAEVAGPAAVGEAPEIAAFILAVEVVDWYVRHLEATAAEHPAPYLGGTTPIEATLAGLAENLDIIRGDG